MKLMNDLRKIVDEKMRVCSMDDFEKYQIIQNLLKDDDCFFKIDKTTAYAILQDLDYLKKELPRLYMELTSPMMYLEMSRTYLLND